MADLIRDEALAHSFDQFDENGVQRQALADGRPATLSLLIEKHQFEKNVSNALRHALVEQCL